MATPRPITEPLADVYVIRWHHKDQLKPRNNRFTSQQRHIYRQRQALGQVVLVACIYTDRVWELGHWAAPCFNSFKEMYDFYRDYTMEIE